MLPDQPIIEEYVKSVDLIAFGDAVAEVQCGENREKVPPSECLRLVASRESKSLRFCLRRPMRPSRSGALHSAKNASEKVVKSKRRHGIQYSQRR